MVLILAGLFLAGPALAEDTTLDGVDLQLFRPSLDASGGFSVEDYSVKKGWQFKFSQSLAFNKILTLTVNGTPREIVDTIATTNLIATYGIFSFLGAAIDVPLHIYADEFNVTTTSRFTTGSWGDIRLSIKGELLRDKSWRPGIALLATVALPSGKAAKFLGNGMTTPGLDLILEKNFKFFSILANSGLSLREQKTVGGITFDDDFRYGVGIKVPLSFWDKNLLTVGEFLGRFELDGFKTTTAPLAFLAGLEKNFRNGFQIKGGAGSSLNNAVGNPRFRLVFSVGYSF